MLEGPIMATKDEGKSIDQILDSVETSQKTAANVVRNAFTVGQEAYYQALKITGIDKATGELIYSGDIAEANKAMRDTTYRPFLSHVFAPNATDAQIDAILAVMGDPAHEHYATAQYTMAHRQMKDPIAASMVEKGYLSPKYKEE